MNAEIQTLRENLSEFGLDPKEWVLEIKKKIGSFFELEVRNQSDVGLILQGYADQGVWLNLSYQG